MCLRLVFLEPVHILNKLVRMLNFKSIFISYERPAVFQQEDTELMTFSPELDNMSSEKQKACFGSS